MIRTSKSFNSLYPLRFWSNKPSSHFLLSSQCSTIWGRKNYWNHQKRNFSSNEEKMEKDQPPSKWKFLFIIFPLATFGLGSWQLRRWDWKTKLIEDIEQKRNADPIPITDWKRLMDEKEIESLENFKVELKGRYLDDEEIHISPRILNGVEGIHLISVFQSQEDPKLRVLVNRGFIPRKKLPDIEKYRIHGDTSLVGFVRKPFEKRYFSYENEPEKRKWYWTDINAMSKALGTLPILIDSADKVEEFPIPISTPELRNDHLSYVITWYSLTAGLTIMSWLFLKKPKRIPKSIPK